MAQIVQGQPTASDLWNLQICGSTAWSRRRRLVVDRHHKNGESPMKRFAGTALLVFLVAVGALAADDIPPSPGAPADKPRAVSPEGVEYLQKLRKNTPFGSKGFDLEALRAG